jgi:hypothetical protein
MQKNNHTTASTLSGAEVAFSNQNSGFVDHHLSSGENPEQIVKVVSGEEGTGLYGSVLRLCQQEKVLHTTS